MKVMHVIEAMHQGGAESLVVEHVRRAAPGIESVVVALNRGGPSLDMARAAGASCHVLGKGAARWSGLQAVARLMRTHRIDVVNGHNPTGALYGTLAARWAGVPAVVRTEHSIHYPGRGSRAYAPVEALLTAMGDRVICVCEAARASHAPRFPWARDRFVAIANGISELTELPSRSAARASLELPETARVALTVGSLTPQKAQDVLLRAFAEVVEVVPDAVLLIAGEGRLERELTALHQTLALGDRVRFLGARTDVTRLMAACDVFVLSSAREGLSITLLEAMRAGRACVATDVGGNREAVSDGDTGRIVPVGDAHALAGAIRGLLADSAASAEAGVRGELRFRERFTAARMVAETEAVYREVLARRGRGGAAHA